MIAIVAIAFGGVTSLGRDVAWLFETASHALFPPHDPLQAHAICNEHYVRVASVDSLEKARMLRSSLILVTQLAEDYDDASKAVVNGLLSSSVRVGYEEQDVHIAHDPEHRDHFIVAVDSMTGPGTRTGAEKVKSLIVSHTDNLWHELGGHVGGTEAVAESATAHLEMYSKSYALKVARALKEVRDTSQTIAPDYFDTTTYSATHGVTLECPPKE